MQSALESFCQRAHDKAQASFVCVHQLVGASWSLCACAGTEQEPLAAAVHAGHTSTPDAHHVRLAGPWLFSMGGVALPIALAWAEAAEATMRELAVRARADERRQLELLGRMASGIAHDINNYVGVILALTECLLDDASPGTAPDLDAVRQAAEQAARLSRQVIGFAHGARSLPARTIAANQLIEDARALLQHAAGDGIELKLALQPHAGDVRVDVAQLHSALLNLVANSRDAMAQGGTIVVSTVATENKVRLVVADTGCGMAPDVAVRAFGRFFSTKGAQGSGLGLSSVQDIATAHGGLASLASSLGVGTTVTIELPRHRAAAAEEPARR